jgi:hypothetical protein
MMKKKQLSPEDVERQKSRFEDWQKKNPPKSFKDYFAETVEAKLQKGRSHETLGGNLRQGDYATSGRGIFQRLLNNPTLSPRRQPPSHDDVFLRRAAARASR